MSGDVEEIRHFVGLDLGQSRDFSAICDIERRVLLNGIDPVTRGPIRRREYLLRFLERPELGTSYPRVVGRTREVCEKLYGNGLNARPYLVVDATGVGRPVVDLLRMNSPLPYLLAPVTITSGDRTSVVDGYFRVPKRDLVASLVVMLQAGTLRVAEGLLLSQVLLKELLNFRMTITAAGNESFSNWREAANDDLVLSVALAAWRASRETPPVNGSRRLV